MEYVNASAHATLASMSNTHRTFMTAAIERENSELKRSAVATA
jgi:hypothetical protein